MFSNADDLFGSSALSDGNEDRAQKTMACPGLPHFAKNAHLFYARRGRLQTGMVRQVKIIVEKHTDGYVAYPLGLKGVVVGEGDSYEEALADVKSAIRFHIETFGADVLPDDSPLLEAFIAEATIPA